MGADQSQRSLVSLKPENIDRGNVSKDNTSKEAPLEGSTFRSISIFPVSLTSVSYFTKAHKQTVSCRTIPDGILRGDIQSQSFNKDRIMN